MQKQENMEEQLWQYIDGGCAEQEKLFVEQLIASNQEWRDKYHELLELQQIMQHHIELDEPSMRFTQNVMEEIARYHIAPAAKSYLNKRVIWGIASFFMLTLLGFLAYAIGQIDWSQGSSHSFIDFSRIDFSKIDFSKIDFSKIDFGKLTNNMYVNIFLMVNTVLGLVLLDMYLGRKKKQLQEHHE